MANTIGEWRCGVSFNPSGNTTVDDIKRGCASLIDFVDVTEADGCYYFPQDEVNRLVDMIGKIVPQTVEDDMLSEEVSRCVRISVKHIKLAEAAFGALQREAAVEHLETAQMYGVKAATKRPMAEA